MRKLHPDFIEAELVAGLRDSMAEALAALAVGAVEEARRLISYRHHLAVSLDEAEEEWRRDGGVAGPDLFTESLHGLCEAAEACGDPRAARAAEDLALLFAAGHGDAAAVLLAAGADPIRQAMAKPAEAGEDDKE